MACTRIRLTWQTGNEGSGPIVLLHFDRGQELNDVEVRVEAAGFERYRAKLERFVRRQVGVLGLDALDAAWPDLVIAADRATRGGYT